MNFESKKFLKKIAPLQVKLSNYYIMKNSSDKIKIVPNHSYFEENNYATKLYVLIYNVHYVDFDISINLIGWNEQQ